MAFKIECSLIHHQITFFIEARNADNMCSCIYVCVSYNPANAVIYSVTKPVMNMVFHETCLVMMSNKLRSDSIISIHEGHICTIHKVLSTLVLHSLISIRPNFLIFPNSHISELSHSKGLSAPDQTQITCVSSFWLSL